MIKYYETKGVHNQDLFPAFLAFLNPHSQRDLHSLFLYHVIWDSNQGQRKIKLLFYNQEKFDLVQTSTDFSCTELISYFLFLISYFLFGRSRRLMQTGNTSD